MKANRFNFRIWDDENKKFDYFVAGDGASPESLDGYFPMQQSTGLLDIDDKEIFEGDIIGYGDNYECEVIWNQEECKFEVKEYKNKDGIRYHNMDAYTCRWTLLGNIYETRWLIDDSKPKYKTKRLPEVPNATKGRPLNLKPIK